jgi:flagellin-like hook-associated protein FlgL
MLSQFAAALNSNNAAAIQQSVGDLSGAHAQVVEARGEVGAMFNVLDQADHARATLEDTMTARVADLTETDVIRAASELVQRSTALSASQAINARLAALLSPAR